MENNTTTTAAVETAQVSAKQRTDVETIYAAHDTIQGIATDITQKMEAYNYPAGQRDELREAFDNLSNELARCATYIVNPTSPDLDEEVNRRINCGID